MMAGRYTHAKQFNRHHRQVRFLRTRLGRLIRDIRRKIAGHEPVEAAFDGPLSRASQIRSQQPAPARLEALFLPRPRGRVHRQGQGPRALRVRRQGLDRHHQARAPGGQFVLHAKALPGNPYDGHTLRDVIEETQTLTGREIERAYVDKGYRGHDTRATRAASSSPARSAASSASSNASSGADPPSSP